MQLRSDGKRQVLPRMRREEARARARLDVFLRRGQHRQVLFGMRREAPGRRAGLPLRQVRLAARRSGASAEILPGMRRPVRRERLRIIRCKFSGRSRPYTSEPAMVFAGFFAALSVCFGGASAPVGRFPPHKLNAARREKMACPFVIETARGCTGRCG